MMRLMIFLTAVVICVLPAQGSVSIVTSHIASDADMLAQIHDLSFVCEGRIGDRGGAATYEQDINTGAVQAQYNWPNKTPVGFGIVYDNLTNLLQFTVGGQTLNYHPTDPFGEIYIRTRAVNAGTSILLDNLILDGVSLGDTSYASASSAGLDILWVRGFADPATSGFTLTGQSTMYWSGSAPTQSRLAYQVKFDNAPSVAEPASVILALAGIACAAGAKRRPA